MSPRLVDPEFAAQVMRDAGIEPLVEYPGAKVKWQCRCLTCGQTVSPLYSTVKQGIGGCNFCAQAASARVQREKGLQTAKETLKGHEFELLGKYENARTQVEVKCLRCGALQSVTLDSIKQGTKKCQCRHLPRKPLVEFRPDLAIQLHPSLNGRRDAYSIGTGERENVWWLCERGHEYESTPANRVHERTDSCPYCSGRKAVPGQTDFVSENPVLASQLSEMQPEGIDPSKLRSHSNKMFRWRCLLHPEHEWDATPSDRIRGFGCPVCAGKKIVRGFNDLGSLHPEIAAEWHQDKNGSLTPFEVAVRANKTVWWLCDEGHEWKASIAPRILGVGCPSCANTGFDSTEPGIFYFIEHPEFLAMKVGITNKNARTDRLGKFKKAGWRIVTTVERENGRVVLELETAMLRWVRKDLGLQAFLGAEDMATTSGHSETFSAEAVTVFQVLERIDIILNSIEA